VRSTAWSVDGDWSSEQSDRAWGISQMGGVVNQYKPPFNHIFNEAQVFTPKDTVIVTPNKDSPYFFLRMDLRVEPLLRTVG
jgi:hypothetical protein